VLQVNKFQNGRWRNIDLHDLPIGSTWCHKLTGLDLFKELQRRKVAGIDQSMGWMQLATVWGNVLADKKEATK